MFKGAKVRYVDTTKSSSISTEVYYNNMLADNKEKISITMDKTTVTKKYGIYDSTVGGIINTEELEVANSATANMYIVNPFKKDGNGGKKKTSSIWSTHPSTEDRIEALRNIR